MRLGMLNISFAVIFDLAMLPPFTNRPQESYLLYLYPFSYAIGSGIFYLPPGNRSAGPFLS